MDDFESKLVTENIALARFLARRSWEKAPHALDLEELTSLAFQGLVSAACRYRSYGEEHSYSEESISSGEFFSVFARRRIIGSMLDSMRDADHVTRNSRRDYKLLQASGYTGKLDKMEELSYESGLTPDRIRIVCRLVEQMPMSTDELDGEALELLDPSQSVEDSVTVKIASALVASTFDQLPDFQKVIIALRYYEEKELKDVALELKTHINEIRSQHIEAVLSILAILQLEIFATS